MGADGLHNAQLGQAAFQVSPLWPKAISCGRRAKEEEEASVWGTFAKACRTMSVATTHSTDLQARIPADLRDKERTDEHKGTLAHSMEREKERE